MSLAANCTNGSLLQLFHGTRQYSMVLCEPLSLEDYNLQVAPFVSPAKWHLAHTSWFFETFLLKPFKEKYPTFDPAYEVLFNSYYNAVGDQYPRPQRGWLSRPSVPEVVDYRSHVDQHMAELLADECHAQRAVIQERVRLGIQHEKQHQELICTDLKFSLYQNPLYPVYVRGKDINDNSGGSSLGDLQWLQFEEGLKTIGVDASPDTFSFDNESPSHRVYLESFSLANRLVTNGEYQQFIDDGGYRRPELWLADGWATVQDNGWDKPLYWIDGEGRIPEQNLFTLHGVRPRLADEPVCHLSAFEADAYATWAGARLPTEAEWECAANEQRMHSAGSDDPSFHPGRCKASAGNVELHQLYDSCWQWTSSAYRPYPGFAVAPGAIGEYNGKFMCNQWVLRGGSCVSPGDHLRSSYRNFFYPQDRWQFSSVRLARDGSQ